MFSPSITLPRGIPHHSILGPLIFVVYANDLSSFIIDKGIYQYADDTTGRGLIICEIPNIGSPIFGKMAQ